MANAQIHLSFHENGRGGLYMYILHAGYKFFSVRARYNPGPTAKYFMQLCFNNYFVVMILDNGMMIWIKIIFKISFFCQTKGVLHGEKILVQYTCTNNEKKPQKIYISMYKFQPR